MAVGATRALVIVCLLALLAGCAANRTTWGKALVRDVYCGTDEGAGLYVPVELSKQDTDGTIEQVLVNNQVFDETCKGN